MEEEEEEAVECTAKRRKGEGEEIAEALLGRSITVHERVIDQRAAEGNKAFAERCTERGITWKLCRAEKIEKEFIKRRLLLHIYFIKRWL